MIYVWEHLTLLHTKSHGFRDFLKFFFKYNFMGALWCLGNKGSNKISRSNFMQPFPLPEASSTMGALVVLFVCLFDLILYVPSTIFQLNRDGSSWVEPVLN